MFQILGYIGGVSDTYRSSIVKYWSIQVAEKYPTQVCLLR